MRSRARRIARENDGKIGLIMVDYLQLMRVPATPKAGRPRFRKSRGP